jgi:enoyl-CoA hydratase
MTEPVVLHEVSPDGVAVVTLNRPQAMNALSRELLDALAAAIEEASADARVRVLILTGAGRAFCAGLDLKELGAGRTDIGQTTVSSRGDPVGVMEHCGKPVIGAINGAAVTGGFELALACDVLIASTEARFADTHARVGILPGGGLSAVLSRRGGPVRA